ncbi:hypothetical protein SSX86_007091 [Deinandra increscens subsp. villosa]|uniref:UV excision repair protein RAD23 n=1 Tax=Deinandra increscens subsp. villosa TaxID=3103831 RepID=A0AAP0DK63_9ASTR
MKVFVKTLKGTHFEIEVKLEDTVADVKKIIETLQGSNVYPAAQQMLIHQGKVLKDGTTIEENKVSENSFIVIMLSKNKSSPAEASSAAAVPKVPETRVAPPPTPVAAPPPPPPATVTPPLSTPATNPSSENAYGEVASNLVSGNNLEGAIQQILDMGGGTWDRDTVVRALRAAFNNPERAVEYLYSGIPESAVLPPPAAAAPAPAVPLVQPTQPAAVPATGPNANPLNLFPQVADVKKIIETLQGSNVYPAAQQMLIHQGKVLKDGTTIEENKVSENSFIVIMLSKNKSSPAEASSAAAVPKVPETRVAPPPTPVAAPPPPPPATVTPPLSTPATNPSSENAYGEVASNLVSGNNLEGAIQQILDMGGGTWDRDTVVRALRAAFNNPERAVEYLYSGIPESAVLPPPAAAAPAPAVPLVQPTQPAAVPATGPNANPLNLFPQGVPDTAGSPAGAGGNLDFLRNSQQFQAFRAMVQANPQILQPMLQELGKQNPQLVRLIQEHQADFLRLINEPVEGGENAFGQLAAGMPQSVTVTPEEREAIERLEAMGFDRALVLEVFFACNKNEELAANYLLDHMHEFEE